MQSHRLQRAPDAANHHQSRWFKSPHWYSFCVVVWSWQLRKRKHTWPLVCSLLHLFQLGGKKPPPTPTEKSDSRPPMRSRLVRVCRRNLEIRQTSYINVRDYSGFMEEAKSKPNSPAESVRRVGNTYSHCWSARPLPVPARSKRTLRGKRFREAQTRRVRVLNGWWWSIKNNVLPQAWLSRWVTDGKYCVKRVCNGEAVTPPSLSLSLSLNGAACPTITTKSHLTIIIIKACLS